jgi:hypothetical protein
MADVPPVAGEIDLRPPVFRESCTLASGPDGVCHREVVALRRSLPERLLALLLLCRYGVGPPLEPSAEATATSAAVNARTKRLISPVRLPASL